MSLLRRVKTILGNGTFGTLNRGAAAVLLIGAGSFAIGSQVASAAALQDHGKNHEQRHEHQSSDDENVKVVVIQEGQAGSSEMIRKIQSDHNIQVRRLPSDSNDMDVVLVQEGNDDPDVAKKIRVHLDHKKLEADGNVEVVVLQEVDSDHPKILKRHDGGKHMQLFKLDPAQNEKIEVIQIQEDDPDLKAKLKGHVVDLLHGRHSGKSDHHELARQLRAIADKLDGKHSDGHGQHKVLLDLDIHDHEKHGQHDKPRVIEEKKRARKIELKKESGTHLNLKRADGPFRWVIEAEGKAKRKSGSDDDQARVIVQGKHAVDSKHNVIVEKIEKNSARDAGKGHVVVRAKKLDPDHNVVIEEMLVGQDEHSASGNLFFGHGKTSDEGHDKSLTELKNELEDLRRELDQLQSKKRAASAKSEGMLRKASPKRFRLDFSKKENQSKEKSKKD